ncbi:DUF6115 domain-containing protein [Paenibacillus agaridevorans]|uniref:DUF6115 domain-containing protein n=1 Tax=Paenibacillus agaridevorans TaxID=171404 RepID=UPI001BE412A5|nr:hypothetical protein [Paenibacillus agaridevorans]
MEPWHYIALLGAVIAVWALSLPRNKAPNPPVQSVQNMETALEQFMENMEKDNEELMEMIANAQADSKQETERKDARIAALEQRCEALGDQLQQTLDKLANTASAEAAANVPVHEEASVVSMPAQGENSRLDCHDAQYPLREQSSARPSDQSQSIASRYSDLFRLYQEGKSIEAIAKKLGMNKGEVQLIIGLAKQEEARHV